MTRRHMLLFGLLLGLLALGLGVWLFWPRTAIDMESFAKIEKGMTLAEVEEVLGGPARDESSGLRTQEGDPPEAAESSLYVFRLAVGVTRLQHPSKLWESDRALIRVDFDHEGRVTQKDCMHIRRVYASPLTLLNRWLGL